MSLGTLGKYERISVLGRGVSGIVYLAKDTLLNKQVALKEVDVQAGDLRRFLEEARVMDRLRHPNIVRVNGVDRIEDKVVIDMEYVRGRNLQEILRGEGPLPIDRALNIGIQILDALDYAHSMQTVHRDIKPANILLTREGEVKLADFGLAEILATNAYACGAGTYAYMAPEDFQEENHSDSQSDIWAVAVTLFEMMTGERPFEVANPKSPFAWKRALEVQEPRLITDFLPDQSTTLAAVISKGLARDKERRYQRAREFRDDLIKERAARSEERGTSRNAVGPITFLSDVSLPSTPCPLSSGREAAYEFAPDTTQVSRLTEETSAPDNVLSPGERGTVTGSILTGVERTPLAARSSMLAPSEARRNALGLKKRIRACRLAVSHKRIDFGKVRYGDSRQARLNARLMNLEGAAEGRVTTSQKWLSVTPTTFDASRQVVTVSLDSGMAEQYGVLEDSICIETAGGAATVPVMVNVLKPRPTFGQVAHWFLPLFAFALAPSTIVAAFGGAHPNLSPPAAVSSLALGLMLLLIGVAADVGMAERIACGVMMACMCFVLGLEAATFQQTGYNGGQLRIGLEIAAVAGLALGLLILVQLLTVKRWRFWGVVLVVVSLLVGSVCYHAAVG